MSRFGEPEPMTGRRRNSDGDGRLPNRVGLTESVAIAPLSAPSPQAGITDSGSLLSALGLVSEGARAAAGVIRDRREDLAARERGLGAEFAGEDAEPLAQSIINGDLAPREGENVQDFVSRVIVENSGGLNESAQEAYRRRLTPALTRAFIDRQESIRRKSEAESTRLIGEATVAATSGDEVTANIEAYRRLRPDASEVEVVDAVLQPALDDAAAQGDTERFEMLAGFVPEDRAGMLLRMRRTLQTQADQNERFRQAQRDDDAREALEALLVDGRIDAVPTQVERLLAGGASPSALRPYLDRANREIEAANERSEDDARRSAKSEIDRAIDGLSVADISIEAFRDEVASVAERYADLVPDFDVEAVVRDESAARFRRMGAFGDVQGIERLQATLAEGDDRLQEIAEEERIRALNVSAGRSAATRAEVRREAIETFVRTEADTRLDAVVSGAATAFDVPAQTTVDIDGEPVTIDDDTVKGAMLDTFKQRVRAQFPDDAAQQEAQLFGFLSRGFVDPQLTATLGGASALLTIDDGDAVPEAAARGYELYKRMRAFSPGLIATHAPSGPAADLYDLAFQHEQLAGLSAGDALVQSRRVLDRLGGEPAAAISDADAAKRVRNTFGRNLANEGEAVRMMRQVSRLYAHMGDKNALEATTETMKTRFAVIDKHLTLTGGMPPENIDAVADLMRADYDARDERKWDAEDIRIRASLNTPDLYEMVGPDGLPVEGAPALTAREVKVLGEALAFTARARALNEARARDDRRRGRAGNYTMPRFPIPEDARPEIRGMIERLQDGSYAEMLEQMRPANRMPSNRAIEESRIGVFG